MVVTPNMRHLYPRSVVGGIKPFLRDASIREKRLAVGNATHLQALKAQWLKALAQNEFGTPATDVDYQPRVFVIR